MQRIATEGSTENIVSLPVLWHFPISHYNEKARWALDYKGIPHRRVALGVGYLPRALWRTGQGSLPILIREGEAIADSTRIIAALERWQPEPALFPQEESARRRALELEDDFDENLGPSVRTLLVAALFDSDPRVAVAVLGTGMADHARRVLRSVAPLFRSFYTFRHRINAETRAAAPGQVGAALDRIEAELQPSGYLVEDAFSVADLTAAALLAPLVRPPEFPYPPPADALPEWLAERLDEWAGRRAFQWVLEMYRRHRGTSAEVTARPV